MTFAAFLSHIATQLNSAVLVLLVILAAAFWVVYKAGQIIALWNTRDSEIAKLREDWHRDIPPLKAQSQTQAGEIAKLREDWHRDIPPLKAQVKSQGEELAKFRTDWNRDIPPLKAKMDFVFQKLYPDTSVKADSPPRLTDVGREIARALNADAVTETHLDKLRELVNESAPQTLYDLQQACFSVAERHLPELLDDAQMRIAKDQSFKHGIPLDNALAIFGVLLRDRLIAEKGWTLPADENKRAPAE